jgi:hypothetical protein
MQPIYLIHPSRRKRGAASPRHHHNNRNRARQALRDRTEQRDVVGRGLAPPTFTLGWYSGILISSPGCRITLSRDVVSRSARGRSMLIRPAPPSGREG